MSQQDTKSQFTAKLLRPENPGDGKPWAFVILPLDASASLPRRGRITVDGTINGLEFRALLEPDGQKSHWLRLEQGLLKASGAAMGEVARFEIMPASQEPDPEVPTDFLEALQASPEARATWEQTTTVARLDWIHWITSAKQTRTRAKRINDACDKLARGNKRVCCFDPSGYYSKAFCAPQEQEDTRCQ
ncbi:MAG TPA: YdeI/OmpD-associated family protein [Xanthomonadales bacterium]|nr:YdeI/OmpD-associated family protein [Xanthomonadales bacterium]